MISGGCSFIMKPQIKNNIPGTKLLSQRQTSDAREDLSPHVMKILDTASFFNLRSYNDQRWEFLFEPLRQGIQIPRCYLRTVNMTKIDALVLKPYKQTGRIRLGGHCEVQTKSSVLIQCAVLFNSLNRFKPPRFPIKCEKRNHTARFGSMSLDLRTANIRKCNIILVQT